MPTIVAKPGVSPSSAQQAASANRVSQDIGGRSNPNWKSSGGGGGGGRSSSSTSVDDMFSKYVAMIQANTAQNNAWSAQQAQINRDWQEKMLNANNAFNSQEAQKNRDWQERLSNTAHQREVKDLLAAGLNPVLSAMNGNGASTTSGATASSGSSPSGAVGQTDTSANGALVSLLGALVSSQVQQENARLSAQTNLAVAEKYNQMSKYTAELGAKTQIATTNAQLANQLKVAGINAQTALSTANISAMTSRYVAQLQSSTSLSVAQINKAASIASASLHAQAQKFGSVMSYLSADNVADINSEVNKDLQKAGFEHDFDMKKMYPGSLFNVPGSIGAGLTDMIGDTGDFLSGLGSDLYNSAKTASQRTGFLDFLFK